MFKENALILFQGDSITDCGRDREHHTDLGSGYPFFLSSILSYKHPDKEYSFLNRGISGNRIVDLYARVKEDIINISPDVLSILIGVNDVWHEFQNSQGVSGDKFKKIYAMLLDEVKENNPDITLALVEPFVLKAGEVAQDWDKWLAQMHERQGIVKSLAEEYNAVFVPLQDEFDRLSENHSPAFWAEDGVHPTNAGHMAIAYRWTEYLIQEDK
jgi:lysophospholipase L1-like esterase